MTNSKKWSTKKNRAVKKKHEKFSRNKPKSTTPTPSIVEQNKEHTEESNGEAGETETTSRWIQKDTKHDVKHFLFHFYLFVDLATIVSSKHKIRIVRLTTLAVGCRKPFNKYATKAKLKLCLNDRPTC